MRSRRSAALPIAALSLLAACGTPLAAPAPTASVEGEQLRAGPQVARVVHDRGARGGRALALVGAGRAVARRRLPAATSVTVVARRARCGAAPRLVLTLDGRRALARVVRRARWSSYTRRVRLRRGRHAIGVALANPSRSRSCRRRLYIDRITFRPTVTHPSAIWRPAPHTTWQWQLTTPVDQSVDAQMYDIDLFDNDQSVVDSLHAKGRRVVCYLNAGALENWRPDAGRFPASVVGKPLEGWDGESWLDIRRLDVLGPILERRLDLCRAKGFDAVEPDNVDGYANDTGFPLSAADQLAFNRFVARAAHARGLSVGLKNDLDQAAELEPYFDWALDEQCFQYDECDALNVFRRAGKAVFTVEYDLPTASFCARARAMGFMSMRKRLSLDAWREACW